MTYKEIQTVEEWKDLFKKPNAFLLLKHSTSCPVSAAAYEEFVGLETGIPKFLVKVIESRPVSNQIAEDVQLTHQSPQILFIQNGELKWDASHWNVKKSEMETAIQ